MIWKLSGGGLAVNCSTLVDLQRKPHGLRLMPDVLTVPPDWRSKAYNTCTVPQAVYRSCSGAVLSQTELAYSL